MENPIALSDLVAQLRTAQGADELSLVFNQPYLLVDLSGWPRENPGLSNATNEPVAATRQPNCPVVALADDDANLPDIVDLAVGSKAELEVIDAAIRSNTVAATTLVQLLRHNERSSVADGLFAESLSYSVLQAGASFQHWLLKRTSRTVPEEDNSNLVAIERQQQQLQITLNRPAKRNAYSAALRDALYEALTLLDTDTSLAEAVIRGAGVCFSAGGDLDEFGAATDPALAHQVRMTRHNGLLLHQLRKRTIFNLHGACIGAGIELPAFSDRVVAAEGSFFQLPELAMGLIPGAGGTVSISRRIGRQRTALMAISNRKIDTETALRWGLIDAIS